MGHTRGFTTRRPVRALGAVSVVAALTFPTAPAPAAAAPVTSTDPLFCATLTPESISEFALDGWTTSVDYPATGAAGSTVEVTIDISPTIVNESTQPVEVAAASYAVDVQDRWGRVVASASGTRQPLAPTTVGVGAAFPAIAAATFDLTLPGSDTDRSYHLVPSVAYANEAEDLDALSFGFCAPTDNDDYDTPLTSAFPVEVTGTPGTAPRLTLSSAGPFRGGEHVVVSGSGFEPFTPVVVLECAKSRVVFEPADCAPDGAVDATQAAADGTFTATVTVVAGALGNATPPAETCSVAKACVLSAFGLFTPGQAAAADLVFTASAPVPPGDGGDGGEQPEGEGPAQPAPADDGAGDGADDGADDGGRAAAPGGVLAATGTSPAALLTALALIQLGAVLAVRASRC